jgi:hypothetical protein
MQSTTSPNGREFRLELAVDRHGAQPLNPPPADKRTARERLLAWLLSRHVRRELAAKNAADLLDRFGPAAPGIAQNCANRAVGVEERRLWAMVIRKIGNQAPQSVMPASEW